MTVQSLREAWTKIRLLLMLMGAYAGRFLGGFDAMLGALITLMALDYLSGVILAFCEKRLSSRTGFRGLCKKALVLLIVGAAAALDQKVLLQGAVLRSAVISFYIGNEALSLTENAASLGLPVPEKLKSALEALHEKHERQN